MKKLTAYCLLFIFVFNLIGYSVILELDRHFVRQEMEEQIRLHPGACSVIEVPDNSHDLKRLSRNEIEYLGNRYDVLYEFRTLTMSVFHCIRDIREENLVKTAGLVNHKHYCLSLYEHLIKDAIPVYPVTPGKTAMSTVEFLHGHGHYDPVTPHTWSPPPELS